MYPQRPIYPATAYPPPVAQPSFDQRYSPMGATTPLPPVGMTLPGGNPSAIQTPQPPIIPQQQYLVPPMGHASVVPQMAAPVAGGYGVTNYPNVGGYGGAYTSDGYGGYGGAYSGGHGEYGGQYLMPPRQTNPSVIIIDNGQRRHRSHSHDHRGHRHHSHSHSHSRDREYRQYGNVGYYGHHGGLRRTRSYAV